MRLSVFEREASTEVLESRDEAPIVSEHRIIEEGQQEAAIGAFLLAHEGHAQDVEVQCGAWSVYCRCRRCNDVRTYEVDNEARARTLGLPPWPESKKRRGNLR
jgi:hypothetical protein